MEHTYCVIMAGGKGERFWPLSTAATPKPFIKLIGDKTMIQMTVQRVAALVPKERIFVVLGEEHVDVARRQLPELSEDQFIVEPEGRDTGPCIGFTALLLSRRDPEGGHDRPARGPVYPRHGRLCRMRLRGGPVREAGRPPCHHRHDADEAGGGLRLCICGGQGRYRAGGLVLPGKPFCRKAG